MGLTTSPVLGCVRPGDSDFASTDAAIERLMTTTRANIARCIADGHRPDIIAASLATLMSELLLGSFDLDCTQAPLAKIEIPSHPATPSYEFRRSGDFWQLAFGLEKPFHVRDLKGMSDIAQLLKSPGKFIPVWEIAGAMGLGVTEGESFDDGLRLDYGRGISLVDQDTIDDLLASQRDLEEQIVAATDRGALEEVNKLREVRSPVCGLPRLSHQQRWASPRIGRRV